MDPKGLMQAMVVAVLSGFVELSNPLGRTVLAAGELGAVYASPAVRPVLREQALEQGIDREPPRIRQRRGAAVPLTELLAQHRLGDAPLPRARRPPVRGPCRVEELEPPDLAALVEMAGSTPCPSRHHAPPCSVLGAIVTPAAPGFNWPPEGEAHWIGHPCAAHERLS